MSSKISANDVINIADALTTILLLTQAVIQHVSSMENVSVLDEIKIESLKTKALIKKLK